MSALQPEHEPATLVGLLDGLIDRGVHVTGDVVIGLADVELIRVALRLLVASEDTAQRTGSRSPQTPATRERPPPPVDGREADDPRPDAPAQRTPAPPPRPAPPGRDRRSPSRGAGHPSAPRAASTSVTEADRDQLVRGVSQLVLTLVEVIRELLERQAVRRVEAGSLTDDQVERLGVALEALQDRMSELKDVFGFDDDELNLDLGPLGRLR